MSITDNLHSARHQPTAMGGIRVSGTKTGSYPAASLSRHGPRQSTRAAIVGSGRRSSRLSVPFSVRALKSRSAIVSSLARQDVVRLFRVQRQCLRHPADRLEVVEVDRARFWVVLPVIPRAASGRAAGPGAGRGRRRRSLSRRCTRRGAIPRRATPTGPVIAAPARLGSARRQVRAAVIASGRPGNWRQSPRKSERMVITT